MRATNSGRGTAVRRATAWALGALAASAVGVSAVLVWEVLVDPLALAELVESLVGR